MAAAQPVQAETFTSAEFLKFQRDTQAFYISTAIGMASLIVAQNDKRQSQCIDDWYYTDVRSADEHIMDVMKDNSSYHPRAIIFAILEKQCGSFRYSNG